MRAERSAQPSAHDDPEIVVVGAGPTGLLLAGDLAAAGVRTTVLERRRGTGNLTRAFAVHARTLELLDARGLADRLAATGTPVEHLRLFSRVDVDLSTLPSRFPYLLVTAQTSTEAVLAERARQLGAQIVHGAEVVGLAQDATGVDLTVRDDGGATVVRRAAWVVGTDGVRSAVRHALGLPFPGETVLRSIMLADVRLARPPADVLTVAAVGDAFAFVAPFGDGWHRVMAWDRASQCGDDVPLTFEEVRKVVRRALGDDHGMHDPRWLSRFHSDERQAPRYRVGRVLLAGDAAHVHSPAGGLGMNTGLQDAANLGWKLAAVVAGWAPEGLLDTYEAERHPVGRAALGLSGTLIRAATLRSPVARAVRGAGLAAALRVPVVARRIVGRISGIGIAYRRPRGAHRLVGRRAGDVALADGGRLYEELRAGRFVLLAGDGVDLAGWADRVRLARPAEGDRPWMLVRPDGYVAWAAAPGGRGDALARPLSQALRRWCGPASRRQPPQHRPDGELELALDVGPVPLDRPREEREVAGPGAREVA